MAVMQFAFTSRYLHVNTNVAVILPDLASEDIPQQFYEKHQKYRVLWLLPGMGCNHSKWLRQTNVERYACRQDTVVVMPSAQNSDYLDWNSFSTGLEAKRFFLEELMPLMQAWLPISSERSKNAIAGITDAPIRLALSHPQLFAAAFKLYGPLTDYETLLKDWEPVKLLAPGKEAACRQWRETADPEELRLLNTVDNCGGIERLLSSDCNVPHTLNSLTREEAAKVPNLHFFAGPAEQVFVRYLKQLAWQGVPVDICPLSGKEDGGRQTDNWSQLDCAIETVLEQFGKEDGVWR